MDTTHASVYSVTLFEATYVQPCYTQWKQYVAGLIKNSKSNSKTLICKRERESERERARERELSLIHI